MARIAFFTERLPNGTGTPETDPIAGFSYELMSSLADLQHDVTVYTTYREDEVRLASHPRLQILRPFRRWSWLEIPRLIPILMEFQPEIVHLIEPRAESLRGWTNAMGAIPAFAPLLGRPRVIVSFYDLSRDDLTTHRQILFSSDLVTVSTRQQAKMVEDWSRQHGKRTTTAILPLPSRRPVVESAPSDEIVVEASPVSPALEKFISGSESTILVPGDVSDHVDPRALFELLSETMRVRPNVHVILGGGWGRTAVAARAGLMSIFESKGVGARVLLTGPLTVEAEIRCLEHARVAFMASLRGESLSLVRWNREALEARVPVVMSHLQCELDPLPWRDRENAFLVSSASDWGSTLAEALADDDLMRAMRSRLVNFALREAVDQPGNRMSRLYAELLGR